MSQPTENHRTSFQWGLNTGAQSHLYVVPDSCVYQDYHSRLPDVLHGLLSFIRECSPAVRPHLVQEPISRKELTGCDSEANYLARLEIIRDKMNDGGKTGLAPVERWILQYAAMEERLRSVAEPITFHSFHSGSPPAPDPEESDKPVLIDENGNPVAVGDNIAKMNTLIAAERDAVKFFLQNGQNRDWLQKGWPKQRSLMAQDVAIAKQRGVSSSPLIEQMETDAPLFAETQFYLDLWYTTASVAEHVNKLRELREAGKIPTPPEGGPDPLRLDEFPEGFLRPADINIDPDRLHPLVKDRLFHTPSVQGLLWDSRHKERTALGEHIHRIRHNLGEKCMYDTARMICEESVEAGSLYPPRRSPILFISDDMGGGDGERRLHDGHGGATGMFRELHKQYPSALTFTPHELGDFVLELGQRLSALHREDPLVPVLDRQTLKAARDLRDATLQAGIVCSRSDLERDDAHRHASQGFYDHLVEMALQRAEITGRTAGNGHSTNGSSHENGVPTGHHNGSVALEQTSRRGKAGK